MTKQFILFNSVKDNRHLNTCICEVSAKTTFGNYFFLFFPLFFLRIFLPSGVANQRLLNHSARLAISFRCKISGLRGGAQRSEAESRTVLLDDGKTGT